MSLNSSIRLAVAATLLTATAAFAQSDTGAEPGPPLSASITGAEGAELGTVSLDFSASGLAVVDIVLTDAPEGAHGVHFHQTGQCEPPFESAGDHLSGDMEHGVGSTAGPHPGDMPNVEVPQNGQITLTYFVPGLTRALVEDEDGTAFILHADPDDYRSQPSGEAGDRLGCALIAPAG